MLKITVKINGMQCGMCEAHINDIIRKMFQVKKVTSFHSKGETIILTKEDIDEGSLRSAIADTGYEVISVTKEPYVKKGLFH